MEQVSIDKVVSALKMRNVEDEAIQEFLHDLYDHEEEQDEDFNYLDSETISKLKNDDKGKDIIMNAPTMKREELKKLVKEYLSKE